MSEQLRITAALTLGGASIGAAAWLFAAGCERDLGPSARVLPAAAATSDARAAPAAARADSAMPDSAAAGVAASARQPIPATYCGPVRVHGHVQSRGRTVDLAEVAFELIIGNRGRGVADWDLTDARGGYEVRLRAARYGVRHEAHAAWIAVVEVPPGRRELRLDLELPRR